VSRRYVNAFSYFVRLALFSVCYTGSRVHEAAVDRVSKGVQTDNNCVISCLADEDCHRAEIIISTTTGDRISYISHTVATQVVSENVDLFVIDRDCVGESSHYCTCTFTIECILLS